LSCAVACGAMRVSVRKAQHANRPAALKNVFLKNETRDRSEFADFNINSPQSRLVASVVYWLPVEMDAARNWLHDKRADPSHSFFEIDTRYGPEYKPHQQSQEELMNMNLLKAFIAGVVAAAVAALALASFAQKTKPTTATYITKEEIDAILATEQTKRGADENTKVIDLGYENFTVGVAHRSSTRTPPPAPSGANASRGAAPGEKCGRLEDTLPPGGTAGGDAHEFQTEGYYIISGGGTIFTDGYTINATRHTNNGPGGIDGPSCAGMSYDVKKVDVKAGDVIIIPAGVIHGWVDVPDHVDYLSFRPLQNLFQPGWVNPTISNMKP
jgi:hypothetical protein